MESPAARRTAVDAIAKTHGLLVSTDRALPAAVRALSDRYNEEGGAVHSSTPQLLSARLQFSLHRDLPKTREALSELSDAGLLRVERMLDLGAGLGASTLGALDALAPGPVDCTLVEPDAKALALATELVPALAPAGVRVTVHARRDSLDAKPSGQFDLIVLGQVLSEDHRAQSPEIRIERHVALLERLLGQLTDSGSLLVVEPALRVRSRHLHHVRNALVSRVFAPCPHRENCPALVRERDWCHEDRSVDLPPWLVPVARAAGLRFQGLTFSYLVLRRDGASVASAFRADARVVSELRRQKGKSQVDLCANGKGLEPLECLDRDAKRRPEWLALRRGALLVNPGVSRLDAESPLAVRHTP